MRIWLPAKLVDLRLRLTGQRGSWLRIPPVMEAAPPAPREAELVVESFLDPLIIGGWDDYRDAVADQQRLGGRAG